MGELGATKVKQPSGICQRLPAAGFDRAGSCVSMSRLRPYNSVTSFNIFGNLPLTRGYLAHCSQVLSIEGRQGVRGVPEQGLRIPWTAGRPYLNTPERNTAHDT